MKKYLILLIAFITILSSNLSAESMYDRIQGMELKMKKMQEEIVTLKASEKEGAASEDAKDSDDEDSDDAKGSDEDGDEDGDDEESDDDEMSVEEQLEEIEESIFELNKMTNGNKLKLGADYRFAFENIQYKMAGVDSKGNDRQGNNGLMTSRLWINMDWKATDNLSFSGQLGYNKTFGQRAGSSNPTGNSAEGFDWVTNENAYDDTLRVRSAYFLYKNDTFLGTNVPWTFSIGRRPSTNGHLVNLRDDDGAASPMGHTINVEFDGLSSKFSLADVVGLDGMYVKFCAGRGMTNATPKFTATPYSETGTASSGNTKDLDMVGLIFVPYNDGKYGIATQYTYAANMIDLNSADGNQSKGFGTVGDLETFTANFTMSGLGNEWTDYLDDTFFFLSGAMTVTHPNKTYSNPGMLGSTDSKTGYSVWAGVQMPSVVTDDGKWGIEYNQGDKYWRPITYGEDTSIGSKIAARGQAYEVYFTEPLVEDILTFQLRYTYIDYEYTGSNGFFGGSANGAAGTGTPMLIDGGITPGYEAYYVDTAQDIRFYLRYRY